MMRSGVPQHPGPVDRFRRIGRAVIVAAMMVAVVGLPATGPVAAADPLAGRISAARDRQNDLKRDIDRQNRLLSDLNKDAGVARAALDRTAKQLNGIAQDQDRVRADIKEARKALAKVQARRAALQERLRQSDQTLDLLEQEIDQGAAELDARRQALGARLADAYRTQNTSLLEQVLVSDSFADVISDTSAQLAYGDQDAAMAEAIAQEQASLDSLRAVTAATRYRTDQLRRAAQDAAADLRAQRARLDAALVRYKKLEKKVKAIQAKQRAKAHTIAKNQRQARVFIKKQQAARRKLDNHIKGLVRQAQARANRMSRANQGGGSGNGRFGWPAAGVITQTYGCTGFYLEPRRGSCAHFHDGIDIANGSGTPIKSVGAGVVAFVGWNRYDGSDPAYVVIIAHGGGFQSFYSHLLPRQAVRAGQKVKRGQLIGYMGATGRATGPHLHFELLRGYDPVDPRRYT